MYNPPYSLHTCWLNTGQQCEDGNILAAWVPEYNTKNRIPYIFHSELDPYGLVR